MPRIPIHYISIQVGYAQVDSRIYETVNQIAWTVEIPRGIRSVSKRQDIILGTLLEDPTALPRCHPYTWVGGGRIPLRLTRVALRPEICDLLFHHADPEILQRILRLTSEIDRVVFVSDDRTDCRAENLREISTQEVLESREAQTFTQ